MSWGVSAIGKPEAVAASIEKQFEQSGKCAEPEETIRQSARGVIAAAIRAQDPASAIQVSASGSQSTIFADGKWGPPCQNQLNIEIRPLFGFVE